MIGALIVTHGNLANELLSAARKIESTDVVIEAVPLEWTDSVDEAREMVARRRRCQLGDAGQVDPPADDEPATDHPGDGQRGPA